MGATQTVQPISGLSTAEAQKGLATSGYSELSPPQTRHVWHIVAEVLREPMFLSLIAASGIYLMLGDYEDALMLLFFVALTTDRTAAASQEGAGMKRIVGYDRSINSVTTYLSIDSRTNCA